MEKLPQEVLDRIVHLCVDQLPSPIPGYAVLSRRWQYAVEQIVFKDLAVNMADMAVLQRVLSDSRRRDYLRGLTFEIHATRSPPEGSGSTRPGNLKTSSDLTRVWNFLSLYWVRVWIRCPDDSPYRFPPCFVHSMTLVSFQLIRVVG